MFKKLTKFKTIALIWILTFLASFGITIMILAMRDIGKF